MNVKELPDKLLDLIFPPRCVFCSDLIEGTKEKICPLCALSLPYTGKARCEQRFENLLACYSPLFYKGNVRESLLRYKFRGLYTYSQTYAKLISKCIDECEVSCDIISWVPVSALRRHMRGYDQAQKLAMDLARLRGVECRRLVRKVRHNKAQSTISDAAKRRANAKGAYKCIEPEMVRGKCILLVDDIVTTGATLSSCAAVLKQAGAASVEAVTLARSEKEPIKSVNKDKAEHIFSLY